MNQMINNIQLARKLVCMLRTYRKCNITLRFAKLRENSVRLNLINHFVGFIPC